MLNGGKVEWRLKIPATAEAVDRFCVEFHEWRERNCCEVEPFAAELLLREALGNSVIHGCGGDPQKRVSCLLRARSHQLLIAVCDEGNGFDWRSARNQAAEASDAGGRGIEIIRHYADAIRFNSKGNALALLKRY